ncbi:MAG: hypothetical protein ABID04_03555 [Patescibacteria group bacterium]
MKKAVLKTLIYADLFDYPLTAEELYRRLIGKRLLNNPFKDKFYFLPGRQKLLKLRRERELVTSRKMTRAKQLAGLLRLIPTVKLVGVTGSVAANNAKSEDDIDFLIIAQSGCLWTTRFLVTLLLWPVKRKSKKTSVKDKNKICLNLFLDTDHLGIFAKQKDLFLAHEVLNLKLVWDRNDTYQKFLKANYWVKEFLPNCTPSPVILRSEATKDLLELGFFSASRRIRISKACFEHKMTITAKFARMQNWIEKFFYHWQLAWMKGKRTDELVGPHLIAFHPGGLRQKVLKDYQEKLALFDISSNSGQKKSSQKGSQAN